MTNLMRMTWQAGFTYWRGTTTAQRVLFVTGTFLFGSMLFHSAMIGFTRTSLEGPVSFRKAATFSESLGLMCWTIGWMLPYFRFGRRATTVLVSFLLVFTVGETFLMSMQVWRGVPSHYNFTSLFDSLVFAATGIGAAGFMVVQLILLALSYRLKGLAPSLRLAIIAGLGISLIGSSVGVLMGVNNSGIWQGFEHLREPDGKTGGDMVLLHALGLHGMQVAPLLAWLLTYSRLAEGRRFSLTLSGVISYAAILLVLSIQTFQARSLSNFDLSLAICLALAVFSFLTSSLLIGLNLRKQKSQRPVSGPETRELAEIAR